MRVLVLFAFALVLAGCGGDTKEASKNLVAVKITDKGCPAPLELPAGPTTFAVSNDDAESVDEFEILDGDEVLGEAEDVTPGRSGTFSLTLSPGSYRTYCPGGSSVVHGKLTVSDATR